MQQIYVKKKQKKSWDHMLFVRMAELRTAISVLLPDFQPCLME